MKKQTDNYGFNTYQKNPISKVGVFDYLRYEVDENTRSSDKDAMDLVKVYRPEKVLSSKETIESFNNIPWIATGHHQHLTIDGKSVDDVDNKGAVYNAIYEKPYLKADLKVFSKELQDKINSGELKELSCGYTGRFKRSNGVYNGQNYDYVQTSMLGNHLASVKTGRVGHDVKVGDSLEKLFLNKINLKGIKKMDVNKIKSLLNNKSFMRVLGDALEDFDNDENEQEKEAGDDMASGMEAIKDKFTNLVQGMKELEEEIDKCAAACKVSEEDTGDEEELSEEQIKELEKKSAEKEDDNKDSDKDDLAEKNKDKKDKTKDEYSNGDSFEAVLKQIDKLKSKGLGIGDYSKCKTVGDVARVGLNVLNYKRETQDPVGVLDALIAGDSKVKTIKKNKASSQLDIFNKYL